MVFSSTIFLFGFLPTLITLYFVVPRAFKNSLLLFSSLLFYSWGEGIYLLLILISISINYFIGLAIASTSKSKAWLSAGIILNLGLLISFKYINFLNDNINVLLRAFDIGLVDLAPVHLPLGISFFTFQAISYLVDLYRNQIAVQRSLLNLGLYLSFFPQLIAGPIVRYKTIAEDIIDRRESLSMFSQGAERFVYGLAKKMLIANPMGLVVDAIFATPGADLPMHIAWLGIICYAIQIYFDFSGYSDMAIGLGRMFGFRFLENFNYPYVANSLQDFWRRWHISLSSWFRDYLYIPLGGNRVSPLRTYANLFCVFLLCGLWHGASWNFIVWGALHGFVLAIERMGLSKLLVRLWLPLRHAYLLVVVLITWVFFRADSLSYGLKYLSAMFSFNFSKTPLDIVELFSLDIVIAAFFGILLATPLFRKFKLSNSGTWQNTITSYSIGVPSAVLVISLLGLSIIKLASNTHNPFIYFRF